MLQQERLLYLFKSTLLFVLALFMLSACESTPKEEESSDGDIKEDRYPVATVTVPALVSVKADFIELLHSRVDGAGIDDVRELERLADVIVSLENVLDSDLETTLHTRDPALAIDMMGWSSDLAGELLAEVNSNSRLVDQLGGLNRSDDLGEDNPSGLSRSPGLSGFESSLGGLMDSLSNYMQGGQDDWPGEGEDNDRGANNESDDAWVNYLNDKVPQGADPDPNDPDVDATGDTWNDYLNDDAAPGADPDRPEDDSAGEGEEVEVGEGDVVVIWTDEDGNMDRVEKNEGEGGSGSSGNGSGTEGGDSSGDGGETGTDGDGGNNPDSGSEGGENGSDGDGQGEPGNSDEEMPCDPNIDGCNSGGGEVPETDPNDGTTQPGPGDTGGGNPEVDLDSSDDDLGPLILVGPDHQQGGAVVVVIRPPTYGQTQPGLGDDRFNGGFWKGDADTIGGRIDELFSRSHGMAEELNGLCASGGC